MFILQKKLRNNIIININFNVDDERFKFEKMSNNKLKNHDFQMINDAKKQTMRRDETRKVCENENF